MNLIGVAVLYVIGVLSASYLTQAKGRRVRGLIPAAIGAALAGAIYSASSTAQYASAAVLFIAFHAIALPLLGFGVGMFTGSVSGFMARGWAGQSARFVAVIAPVGAMLGLAQMREVQRDLLVAKTAQREAEFQLTDVQGVFAGVPVTLPASPDIDLYHDCWNENRGAISRCRTMFRSAKGIRLQEGLPSPPVIHEIHIRPGLSDQAAWCGKRPDLATRVWCSATFSHEIRLSDQPTRLPDAQWTRVGSQAEGRVTFCRQDFNGYFCQVRFKVASSVHALVWMKNPDPGRVTAEAAEMQGLTKRVWDDILSGNDP